MEQTIIYNSLYGYFLVYPNISILGLYRSTGGPVKARLFWALLGPVRGPGHFSFSKNELFTTYLPI